MIVRCWIGRIWCLEQEGRHANQNGHHEEQYGASAHRREPSNLARIRNELRRRDGGSTGTVFVVTFDGAVHRILRRCGVTR